MKLRAPLTLQQLLFAAGRATAAILLAQALNLAVRAQDVIILTTGESRTVKVLGVSPSGQTLDFQVGPGQLGLPLANLKEVRMTPPPEYNQAIAAYQAKDFAKSLGLVKGLVARFRGMPSPWAQQMVGMLGELYIAMNDIPKAEAAYADFRKFYPNAGSLQSEVGLSRIAVAKQDFQTAGQKVAPITEAALKEKTINPANVIAYSQAFLVSGEVKEAAGNFSGALEDYLRTVTLFYHDRIAVSTAQERADALRAAHPGVTVP
jgi:predicted Zn-dependent protease